ncbi:hypothetical protein A2U01_0101178, partial [Trifolium medium]|nr:hypothetical protein [Trifolium medium]
MNQSHLAYVRDLPFAYTPTILADDAV